MGWSKTEQCKETTDFVAFDIQAISHGASPLFVFTVSAGETKHREAKRNSRHAAISRRQVARGPSGLKPAQ